MHASAVSGADTTEAVPRMLTSLNGTGRVVGPSLRTVRLLFGDDVLPTLSFTSITVTSITELVGVGIQPGLVSKVCPVVLTELL